MNIAIIGTRGIPNNYGGFEQLAEYLSVGLVQKGHRVTVYCSSRHQYRKTEWKGVKLQHIYDPEPVIGTAGQFIYDLLCIWHCRKSTIDVVLNLGYTSSSVWLRLISKNKSVITNMDGLEWKRTKYNKPVRWFLKYAEALAVKRSTALIADSIGIQEYLKSKYAVSSRYIAYGADVYTCPNPDTLKEYNLEAFSYNLLIARMEPENNIEMILDGIVKSTCSMPCVVIGNTSNSFGRYLLHKYRSESRIRFLGSLYDIERINPLRYYSNIYFHGHSVGGTNPSLLEAMGCKTLICAHDNIFNRSVLEQNAFFFNTATEVCYFVEHLKKSDLQHHDLIQNNLNRIETLFSWNSIISAYEQELNHHEYSTVI